MRCPACGFENASGIKFCGECGAPLKLKCASCDFENAPGIKFCGECGKPLAHAAKSGGVPDPRSYTPKHLAEKILTSRAALEGGRLPECLAVAEEGLELSGGDLDLAADRIGFSPSLGFSNMKGAALSLMGRLRGVEAELDRVSELARVSQQLFMVWSSHSFQVTRCEITGEAASALAHARQAVDYAERTGSQFGRSVSYYNLGAANVLNRAWYDVLEALEQALTIAREQRLLLNQGRVLAEMAAARLGLGARERALALADEAIEVCRRIGTRLFEFSAQLTRVRALRETPGPPSDEGDRCRARRSRRLARDTGGLGPRAVRAWRLSPCQDRSAHLRHGDREHLGA